MTMKKILSAFICAMLLIATTGCGSMNNTQKGAAIGAGAVFATKLPKEPEDENK